MLLAVVAAAAAWYGTRVLGAGPTPRLGVVVPLTALGIGGVLLRERKLGPHIGVSVTSVVLAAAVALAGPGGAALIGLFAFLGDVRRTSLRTRLFNAAMAAAIGGVGGVVYLLASGRLAAADQTGPLTQIGIPLLLAHAAMTLFNVVAIGLMASAVRGGHVISFAGGALRSLGWGVLTHLIIAFLFVVLWEPAGLGALSALFVLGPLVVAHWSIGREAQARREHEETVTSFVAALELADPASAGHSARVADLSERMAGALRLGGQQAEDLRYAALLHDIGLVTVRAALPADPEVDEVGYLSAISAHPESGVAVLRGIDFLTGALPAIAHHHERYDGRGYPAGLEGEDIPVAARVIAVADAYDALTAGQDGLTDEAAVEALRGRAGTHLDPVVVEALAEVLPRRPSTTPSRQPAAGDLDVLPRTHRDHDHPSVSDIFAEWQPESVAGAR